MQDTKKLTISRNVKGELFLSGASLAAASVITVGASPAQAQVSEVAATVTSLGTLTGITVPIVLTAMGVRLAIKLVNRMTVKG